MNFRILTVPAAILLAGCGDGLSPGNVTVGFRAADDAPFAAPGGGPWASATRSPAGGAPARAIAVEGSNGTLVLDRVLMIVSELELEEDDACEDDRISGKCRDFDAEPYLMDLPLDGTVVSVVSALIPPGVYDELEFEVEDLDDDDDDKRGVLDRLWNEIRTEVPDWPRKASVYVTGTFQAPGEDPLPFRTFIEAEIEVELDLRPSLVIGEDGSANRDIVVDVRPDLWFRDSQGRVRDLTQWDYDATGRLLELEVEIEDGFVDVEFDD